ncbi:MAG: hypothetical protein ACK5IJ_07555 [Mangrovibacterium sp.]
MSIRKEVRLGIKLMQRVLLLALVVVGSCVFDGYCGAFQESFSDELNQLIHQESQERENDNQQVFQLCAVSFASSVKLLQNEVLQGGKKMFHSKSGIPTHHATTDQLRKTIRQNCRRAVSSFVGFHFRRFNISHQASPDEDSSFA